MSSKLPILVINLDRRVDRWESICAFFQEECERNKAIETPIRISAVADAENPGRGCAASHQKCLEYAREKQWKSVLVLEDDARLRPCFDTSYFRLISELPENWMAVFLGPGRVKGITYHTQHLLRMRRGSDTNHITGSHAILYHQRAYDLCIQALTNDGRYLVHPDLILSDSIQSLFVPVPYLADFSGNTKSDIRSRVNFSNENEDLQLLLETEKKLMELMRKYEKNKVIK